MTVTIRISWPTVVVRAFACEAW